MEILWHKHHILPKRMGGTNRPYNLLKCNAKMHSFMHNELYKEHNDIKDKIAANCLSKQKTVSQEHYDKFVAGGFRNRHARLGAKHTDESKAKMSGKRGDYVWTNRRKTCKHFDIYKDDLLIASNVTMYDFCNGDTSMNANLRRIAKGKQKQYKGMRAQLAMEV